MKKPLLTLFVSALLLGPAAAAQAQVSVGIRIGPPPAPRAYRVPPQPTPNHEWVEGHWAPQGSKYRWHDGQWAKPPRPGAYWQEPYYANGRYYAGRWDGGTTTNRSSRSSQRNPR